MTHELPETGPIDFADFLKVDLRIGIITAAKLNPKARKPAFALTIDFGDLGSKQSSTQLTENYSAEDLVGRQVMAVMNFPPKRVAGVKSEVLVLAAVCPENGTTLLAPDKKVGLGVRIL